MQSRLRIGDTVQLVMADGTTAKSSVYDRDGDLVTISSIGYSSARAQYDVFYLDSKSRDSVYKVNAVAVKGFLYEDLPALMLRIETDEEKVQRRNYYRVPYSAKTDVKLFSPGVEYAEEFQWEAHDQLRPVMSKLLDLSAGGMKIKLFDRTIAIGQLLVGRLDDEEESQSFDFQGKIVRIDDLDSSSRTVGVMFLDMPKNIVQQIVAMVFKQERKLLKTNRG